VSVSRSSWRLVSNCLVLSTGQFPLPLRERVSEGSYDIGDKGYQLTEIGESVKPDAKKRVVLPKAVVMEGVTYCMYRNRIGQIVLDPQVTIPASEAWLFKNPEVIASVRQGLADAAKGRVSKVDIRSL
jgi:hypothetical protein